MNILNKYLVRLLKYGGKIWIELSYKKYMAG